jgi:hypothetical protein
MTVWHFGHRAFLPALSGVTRMRLLQPGHGCVAAAAAEGAATANFWPIAPALVTGVGMSRAVGVGTAAASSTSMLTGSSGKRCSFCWTQRAASPFNGLLTL